MSEELSLDGKTFESYWVIVHPMVFMPVELVSSLALPAEETVSYS
jgi:hypothetical protein